MSPESAPTRTEALLSLSSSHVRRLPITGENPVNDNTSVTTAPINAFRNRLSVIETHHRTHCLIYNHNEDRVTVYLNCCRVSRDQPVISSSNGPSKPTKLRTIKITRRRPANVANASAHFRWSAAESPNYRSQWSVPKTCAEKNTQQ